MTPKLLPFLALTLALPFAGHAQTTPAAPTASELTREMSARLQLNEGQYVKLLVLNRTRLARQREIEQSTARDLAARQNQLSELQTQFEQECSRILSPTQLSQLQQSETPPTAAGGNGNG